MKPLLLLGIAVAVLVGLSKLRTQRNGGDVWHEVTSR